MIVQFKITMQSDGSAFFNNAPTNHFYRRKACNGRKGCVINEVKKVPILSFAYLNCPDF